MLASINKPFNDYNLFRRWILILKKVSFLLSMLSLEIIKPVKLILKIAKATHFCMALTFLFSSVCGRSQRHSTNGLFGRLQLTDTHKSSQFISSLLTPNLFILSILMLSISGLSNKIILLLGLLAEYITKYLPPGTITFLREFESTCV